MSKSIPALVTPAVLQWARNLDMISIEEAAVKLKVEKSKIEAWENGDFTPTLTQAKALAKQYRVPFAYLYLPDTPKRTKRLEKVDYRTLGNHSSVEMSRELRWLLRDIEDRRDILLDLYNNADRLVEPFSINYAVNTNEDILAVNLREFLLLTDEIQKKFRKPEAALAHCIAVLESRDVLVFQAAKISPNEMRGLSVAYDNCPIIVLNRKDEISARLFTLIHELVHIVTRTSGVCNDIGNNSTHQHSMELFCNKVAGLVLVPTAPLKLNKNISLIKAYGLDDTYVRAIARDFAVSREVVIHRLWSIGIIGKQEYFDTLASYSAEYLVSKTQKPKKDGFLPPALDNGTQIGKLYAKTVLSAYQADQLSPREASTYLLGLRLKHFDAIERWCY